MLHIIIHAESRYPVERRVIRAKVAQVLGRYGLSETEVSLTFVGDRKMIKLNRKYLHRSGTTDVLSFPLMNGAKKNETGFILPPDNILRLGDIVISYPQARRQAMTGNRTVDEEINVLIEHGLLHLLGIHHEE
jgi:probable rRNA maturation factor